ncbi:MAG TPA: bifunctional UDP-sugar hydrolase/5'-nucleotidase, partial [Candidatus Ozemobacteraceae bacterium]|nr:bifunctional UDP-sugar hydrolase/5'-nucleotidase [Candidatus Ozemobacteraceae bacterium]
RGLACLSTLVRQIRERHPRALLLDNGDTLFGSALTHYHQRFTPDTPNPVIQAMNLMGYDALTIGNHEFDADLAVLASAAAQASFPFLAANIRATGKRFFRPWVMFERQGVHIAVVGVTTPGIPHWADPESYAGLTFDDPIVPARLAVNEARKAGADVIILTAHLGSGVNSRTGQRIRESSWEGNIGFRLVREVAGIDALILGHTHELLATSVAGIPVLQPKALGTHLARVDLHLEHRDGFWQMRDRQGSLVPVASETRPDFPIQASAQVLSNLTRRYLDTPLATSPRHVAAMGCAFVDNPVTDLILQAMLEASGAEVALTALPPGSAQIPSGTVRIRDVHRLYGFDNSIVCASLTGAQLKNILEHSSRFFHGWASQTSQLQLINSEVSFFNSDLAAGIEYTIDLRQPIGTRITHLARSGKPLDPKRLVRVAVSNYRFNGGGEYPSFAAGIDVERLDLEIRSAIIRHLMNRRLTLEADKNWRLLPDEIHELPRTPPESRQGPR